MRNLIQHTDLECETKFRIPEITFAYSAREIPACALHIYFSNSGAFRDISSIIDINLKWN